VSPDDDDLAKRIRRGDAGAFDVLFDRFAARLRGYLVGMVGDAATADDLLQETFLRVYHHIDRYEPRGTFAPWIFRIAGNLAITEVRRRRYRRTTPLDRGPDPPCDSARADPAAIHAAGVRTREVESALTRLPEAQRAVVLLRVRDEMPLEEIARTLRVPVGTVKSRLHHAVKRLREEIGVPDPARRQEEAHEELR
jgi:RNA polymerase sigma-70 factor (ECF subfamily)